jgi:hypothetical protein
MFHDLHEDVADQLYERLNAQVRTGYGCFEVPDKSRSGFWPLLPIPGTVVAQYLCIEHYSRYRGTTHSGIQARALTVVFQAAHVGTG